MLNKVYKTVFFFSDYDTELMSIQVVYQIFMRSRFVERTVQQMIFLSMNLRRTHYEYDRHCRDKKDKEDTTNLFKTSFGFLDLVWVDRRFHSYHLSTIKFTNNLVYTKDIIVI